MKVIEFIECCPTLTNSAPCEEHQRISIYFDFSKYHTPSCPAMSWFLAVTDGVDMIWPNPPVIDLTCCTYENLYGYTSEQKAFVFANGTNVPEPFKSILKVDGPIVTLAFDWVWVVANGLAVDKAGAIAFIENYASIFSDSQINDNLFFYNDTHTICPPGGEGGSFEEGLITNDYCAPVEMDAPLCEAVPYLTARIVFDVGFGVIVPGLDNVRKVILNVPCETGGEEPCVTANYDTSEAVSGDDGLPQAIQDLANTYNSQAVDANGYYINAQAEGDILTLDFVFPDADSFAFFCAHCMDTISLCVKDQWNFAGPIQTSFTTIPKFESFCGCGSIAPIVACRPTESYCLPIVAGDYYDMPIDLTETGFEEGTYRVDLCQGCGVVLESIGTLHVNYGKFGYLHARFPSNLPIGCYSFCIQAITYAPLAPHIAPRASNLFTHGANGTFDTSAWNSGIGAFTAVTLTQDLITRRNGSGSLRAYPTNFFNPIWFTDPITGLGAHKRYVLEVWVNAIQWPTSSAKHLYLAFSALGTDNTYTLITALPSRPMPAGTWIRLAYQIDTGATPNGFVFGALWDGPAFGSFPDYDILFDDITIYDWTPAPIPQSSFLTKTLCSNAICVVDGCNTMVIKATNNGSGLGIPYATFPANFTQFRIGAILRNPQNTAEREIYVDSGGRHIKVWSQVARIVDLETDYLTDNIHEGIVMCLEHDKLEIRQFSEAKFTEYSAFEDYKRTDIKVRPEYQFRKAIGKLKVTPYDKTNSFC